MVAFRWKEEKNSFLTRYIRDLDPEGAGVLGKSGNNSYLAEIIYDIPMRLFYYCRFNVIAP